MERLHQEVASHREMVDISRWLIYTNFDIIGDLAFAESFDCLRNSDYHPWLTILFDSIRVVTFMRTVLIYPLFAFLMTWVVPKSMKEKSDQHYQMSKDKVNRRLATKTNRPDFTSCILRYNDERDDTRGNRIECSFSHHRWERNDKHRAVGMYLLSPNPPRCIPPTGE